MIRLDEPWLTWPASKKVCTALTAEGHSAWYVGGCVRNALLGAPVADIDICTDARPGQVIELAEKAGIKAIPTGIEHGTITLVIDTKSFEVTTLRRDIETDGRRAVVAFADSIEQDALRRDFTMNALYATPPGVILDPIGGLPDILARKVRFIEDADARIKEDYLRSLRFFRFHAWFGDPNAGLDPDAVAAIAANIDGLATLSKERIGAELIKLLTAPDPAPALAAMEKTGALGAILPGGVSDALGPLVFLEGQRPPSAIRRLAAIGGADPAGDLRLSKAQSSRLEAIRKAALDPGAPAQLGYRLGFDVALDAMLVHCALINQHLDPMVEAKIAQGATAKFPIKAADLMDQFTGPALGDALRHLEQRWLDSDFSLTKQELLRR